MDISINAAVECTDGEGGKITRVILNPIDQEITYLVVKEKGLIGSERLVSIGLVVESSPQHVVLGCTQTELAAMENFLEVKYIPGIEPLEEYDLAHYHMMPYVTPDFDGEPELEYRFLQLEHVPPGELEIERGASVYATDGRVGEVDEFMVSPENNHITHLVLQEGHLWGRKLVTIPISQIDHFEDDNIFLKLDKESLNAMPALPVRRHYRRD